MKQRFWIYFTLFALGAVVLMLWLRPEQHQPKSAESKEEGEHTATVGTEGTPPPTGAKDPSVQAPRPLATAQSSTNHGEPQNRVEQLRQSLSEKNAPVNFYGRVIDQGSNALAGVKLKVYIRHWELMADAMSNPIRVEKETDTHGGFEIHGLSGDSLDIESFEKPGYELEPARRSFGPSEGTKENPVLFKMWATNMHEQLIAGQKSFHIVPDGRPYVIDMGKGTIAESGTGDLTVRVKYPTQVVRGQTYDWSCEMDVINGGLLEENNLNASMYWAPIDGYTPSFQLQQQIKGGQYGSTGSRRFYVRLNNGQEYGRISVELYAPYNDQTPGLIRLQYTINPSGSPILR